MRVLVIEDDRETAHFLQKALRESGHVAVLSHDGEEGLAIAREGGFDILIIDRMLPRLDGLTVVRKGLRSGGDDYLAKPYAFSELLARIEALARRRGSRGEETVYRVADLELNRLSHEVSRAGQELQLQPREFRLLEYLMRHAGQVVTRTMLLEHVWDYHFDPQTNVIDVHVSRLRGKIDKGFDEPLLHTIRGAGYMVRAGTH